MTVRKIIALLLVAGGVLALVYGGFTYTEEKHGVKVGEFELAVAEKERVNIPVWLGAASVIAGTILLVAGGRKS